jgi:hypothetical protein
LEQVSDHVDLSRKGLVDPAAEQIVAIRADGASGGHPATKGIEQHVLWLRAEIQVVLAK